MSSPVYSDTRLLIANEWVDAAGGKTIEVRNPATGVSCGLFVIDKAFVLSGKRV